MEELISCIYTTKSNITDATKPPPASESIGFLKSLNQIDGYSFESMLKALIKSLQNVINTTHAQKYESTDHNRLLDVLYKLILLIMINTSELKAAAVLKRLLTYIVEVDCFAKDELDETVLDKIRQEVGPFHGDCFSNAVKSSINLFANVDLDEEKFAAFINNLFILHKWDVKNRNLMK